VLYFVNVNVNVNVHVNVNVNVPEEVVAWAEHMLRKP
jgi:hypothetical protein